MAALDILLQDDATLRELLAPLSHSSSKVFSYGWHPPGRLAPNPSYVRMHSSFLLLPMGHVFMFILSMLGLSVKQSHGAVTSEVYWHSTLPDTPMPSAIRDHLSSGDLRRPFTFTYDHIKEDPVKTARNGADAIIIGPQGNSVTIHRDTRRPITLWYSPYAKNKELIEAPGNVADAAIVTSLDGDPVTIHHEVRSTATYWLGYRTKKDHVPSDVMKNTVQPNANTKNKNMIGTNSDQQAVDNLRIDSPNAISSFLERNLHLGAKMEAMFRRPLEGDHFLFPWVAASIPFSSSRLPEILNRFSIDPNSFEAKKMGQVHYFCELPTVPREKKRCVTTLESMVDFIASSLNGSASNMVVGALSSTADKETVSTQIYTVESFSPVPTHGTATVPCHLEVYPYTVYHCHMTHGIQPYVIKLVGQSAGDTAEAVATCHRDTSDWDPSHPALRAHKVKPGEASMCHLLPVGDLAFILSAAGTANSATQ